jgi:hypothetical protein
MFFVVSPPPVCCGAPRGLFSSLPCNLTQRGVDSLADDIDPEAVVVVVGLQIGQHQTGARRRDAVTWNDAFLDGSKDRVQTVVHAVLSLLRLDLGVATNANDDDEVSQLSQTLLQILPVVIGGGLLNTRPRPS